MDEETREAIMEATYRALVEHGYAELTMQDIADEFDRSKAALHYHYDTKEELLGAYVESMYYDLEAAVDGIADLPPEQRLAALVSWFVFGADQRERERFHLALLELRAQGPFVDAYRERLQRIDDLLREAFAGAVADGIETGAFRETDPDETARLLLSALDGARTRQITLQDYEYTSTVHEVLIERAIGPLLVDDDHERFHALDDDLPTFDEALEQGGR